MSDGSLNTEPDASAQSIWERALGRLQVQVTKPNYDTWLRETIGIACDEHVFVVGTPSDFATEWLSSHLRPLIANALAKVAGMHLDVTFQVRDSATQTTRPSSQATPPAPNRDVAPTEAPKPCLKPGFTFAAFVVGECNRLAHAGAMALAAAPNTLYNPLFIWGPSGLGKTHLLHAIGHDTLADSSTVLLASAEKFTNEFIRAIKANRAETFRSRYRSADVLLVDDIQFLAGKAQTQEEFFHTFNDLQTSGKRIAVTCDRSPQDLTGLDSRLRSRFLSGLVADVSTPCVETRAAILKAKATAHGATISPDVLSLVARRTPGSVRDLEGCLNRLAAYARLSHQPLTVDLANHALAATAPQPAPRTPSADAILDAVCAHFRVSSAALASRSRAKDLTYARHVAMYLLREDAQCSFTDIGRLLGGRDHATALYAHAKIRHEVDIIPQTANDIASLRQQVQPAAA